MSTFDAAVPAVQPSLAARFRLPTGPIQFLGFDKDYWRLWIRGSILLALTLGIYRFWLTTDTRRFLWCKYGDARRAPRIYRNCARASDRLPDRRCHSHSILCLHLSVGADPRLDRSTGWRDRLRPCDRSRSLRRLSCSSLPIDPNRLSWRAIPSDRIGLVLCHDGGALVDSGHLDARARLSDRAGSPRAIQNAQHVAWKSAGAIRRVCIRPVHSRPVHVDRGARTTDRRTGAFILALDTALLWELVSTDDDAALTRLLESHPNLAFAFTFGVGALIWSMLAGMLLYPVFQAMVLRWWSSGLRFGEMAASSICAPAKCTLPIFATSDGRSCSAPSPRLR